IQGTFEWNDPTALSLADALPTLIDLVVQFPVKGQTTPLAGDSVTLAGVDQLTVHARFARDGRDSPPAMKFNLAIDEGGPDGLIAVKTDGNPSAAKIFVTAAALASAFMAQAKRPSDPSADPSAATLSALLLAATALSSFLTAGGRLVIHGVEVEGDLAP